MCALQLHQAVRSHDGAAELEVFINQQLQLVIVEEFILIIVFVKPFELRRRKVIGWWVEWVVVNESSEFGDGLRHGHTLTHLAHSRGTVTHAHTWSLDCPLA